MTQEARSLMMAAVRLMKVHGCPVYDPDADPWVAGNPCWSDANWDQAPVQTADGGQATFPLHFAQTLEELERNLVRPLEVCTVSSDRPYPSDPLLLNMMLQLSARGYRAGLSVRKGPAPVDTDFEFIPTYIVALTVYETAQTP